MVNVLRDICLRVITYILYYTNYTNHYQTTKRHQLCDGKVSELK